MKYKESFKITVELLSKVSSIYSKIKSFSLIDVDGNLLCRYNIMTNSYQFYDYSDGYTDSSSQEWRNHMNAAALAMKSGKFECVTPNEHDDELLKKYCSLAVPIKVEDQCQCYFSALMHEDLDVEIGKEIFKTYASFFEIELARNIAFQKISDNNNLLESVIQALNFGCIIIDPKGTVIYSNEAAKEYTGEQTKVLVGRSMVKDIDTKDLINTVIKDGKIIRNMEVIIKPRGSVENKRVIRTALPVRDKNGQTIAIIDMLRDMKSVRQFVNDISGNRAQYSFDDIVHESENMDATIRQAKDFAWNSYPILIECESGTGKELFAHAIHNESSRRNGPFVVLDCTSITKELAESELFGYVGGAFTGAEKRGKLGKVELANGGTLFLDEIGELPISLQTKLLRLIQSKTFTKVGGTNQVSVDVRIIAATNRDLKEEINKGNFRLDLYYRLNVFSLHIPPLRERKCDIRLLCNYFAMKYKNDFNKRDVSFSNESIELAEKYDWPGNVRELENTVIRALATCEDVIEKKHFSNLLGIELRNEEIMGIPPLDIDKIFLCEGMNPEDEYGDIGDVLDENNGNITQASKALGVSRQTFYRLMEERGIHGRQYQKNKYSREDIEKVLIKVDGNKSKAAKLLGISRKTLYEKLKKQ